MKKKSQQNAAVNNLRTAVRDSLTLKGVILPLLTYHCTLPILVNSFVEPEIFYHKLNLPVLILVKPPPATKFHPTACRLTQL